VGKGQSQKFFASFFQKRRPYLPPNQAPDMNFPLDARVPLIIGTMAIAGPQDLLLLEGEPWDLDGRAAVFFDVDSGHAPGCGCCGPRGAAGRALARALHGRARGDLPFFRRVVAVVVTQAGRAQVEAAVRDDPVASACFRLVEIAAAGGQPQASSGGVSPDFA
jgi:hypothetical protein